MLRDPSKTVSQVAFRHRYRLRLKMSLRVNVILTIIVALNFVRLFSARLSINVLYFSMLLYAYEVGVTPKL